MENINRIRRLSDTEVEELHALPEFNEGPNPLLSLNVSLD